jgi:hypothetical protein
MTKSALESAWRKELKTLERSLGDLLLAANETFSRDSSRLSAPHTSRIEFIKPVTTAPKPQKVVRAEPRSAQSEIPSVHDHGAAAIFDSFDWQNPGDPSKPAPTAKSKKASILPASQTSSSVTSSTPVAKSSPSTEPAKPAKKVTSTGIGDTEPHQAISDTSETVTDAFEGFSWQ